MAANLGRVYKHGAGLLYRAWSCYCCELCSRHEWSLRWFSACDDEWKRWRHRCRHASSTRFQPTPHAFGAPVRVDAGRISRRSSATETQIPSAIVWSRLRDPTFSRLSRTPTCDRQTDRRTDWRIGLHGHSIGLYPVIIASRGKNYQTCFVLQ